jgi:hypothetical protein
MAENAARMGGSMTAAKGSDHRRPGAKSAVARFKELDDAKTYITITEDEDSGGEPHKPK